MAFGGVFHPVFRPVYDPGGAGGVATAAACYYLTFGGSNYGTFSGIAVTPPVTIVAWVRATTTDQQQVLGRNGYEAALQFWTVVLGEHGGTSYGGSTAANVWQHIACTVPASGDVRVWLNGTDATSVVGASDGATKTITQLGRRFDGALAYTGDMAAIGIAGSVLDVAAMWTAGDFLKPLNPATFGVLALNMRDEAGAGTTVDDEGTGNNDATLNAAIWGGTMAAGGPAGWTD